MPLTAIEFGQVMQRNLAGAGVAIYVAKQERLIAGGTSPAQLSRAFDIAMDFQVGPVIGRTMGLPESVGA